MKQKMINHTKSAYCQYGINGQITADVFRNFFHINDYNFVRILLKFKTVKNIAITSNEPQDKMSKHFNKVIKI